MKTTKTQQRINWIIANAAAIEDSRSSDHSKCKGACHNGRTCSNQSSGGFGWWANALDQAGIDPERHNYWSGSAPTPSTSINLGIAAFIMERSPSAIR